MTSSIKKNDLRTEFLSKLLYLLFCIIYIGLFKPIHGQNRNEPFDTLGGILPKIVKAKTYIVTFDIEVPPNTIVTIEPGTVLLFKNFTGLKIAGRLLALGTPAQPIVFTSEYVQKYNPATTLFPNPFDWNGIYIYGDAIGTIMEHCVVSYTVYGIISDTKFIKLDKILFADNGKYDLVIEKEEKNILTEWYSYVLSTQDIERFGLDINIVRDPLSAKRSFFRYTSILALIGGIALGVTSSVTFKEKNSLWKKANTYPPDDDILTTKTNSYYDSLQKKRNTELVKTLVGFGIGTIGMISFVWTFTF